MTSNHHQQNGAGEVTQESHPNGKPVIKGMKRPVRKNDQIFFDEDNLIQDNDLGKILKGLLIEFLSKQEHRVGWARKSACDDSVLATHPNESVAAHMWGVTKILMVLYRQEEFIEQFPNFDRSKALEMAATHDVPEVITGDITPVDGISEEVKHRNERNAMEKIFKYYPESVQASLRQVYNDYESRQSNESKFVKDCDKLDFMIYALLLERQGFSGFQEFYSNTIQDKFFSKIADRLSETIVGYRAKLIENNLLYQKK